MLYSCCATVQNTFDVFGGFSKLYGAHARRKVERAESFFRVVKHRRNAHEPDGWKRRGQQLRSDHHDKMTGAEEEIEILLKNSFGHNRLNI